MDSAALGTMLGLVAFLAVAIVAWAGERRRADRLRTELRATREQLAYSRRFQPLGELAAGFAHRFNEVLTPILGRTQLALQRAVDPEVRQGLTAVERAAVEGAKLARQLRDFSRVEAPVPVDLRTVVADTVERVRAQFRGGTAIRTDLGDVPPVTGDPAGLRDALGCVLMNAIEAMPGGGAIVVSLRAEQGEAVLAVSDHGPGMTTDVRARAFEPFYTTKPDARGLGLAVAHSVAARHGGRLEMESEAGAGTTVSFRLPLADAAPTTTEASAVRAREEVEHQRAERLRALESGLAFTQGFSRHLRCLVVDDDPQVRGVVSDMLKERGVEVTVAEDGAEALEKFKTERFDVVVTDLAMPRMNGLQFTRLAKRAKPTVPVLLLTGYGVMLREDELADHGVDRMLTKPVHIEQLVTKIQALTA